METRKHRVTLVDVARNLGVSPATVSLALRDRHEVALKTRLAVKKAVKDLGYLHNRSAAQLRTQRSYSIGLVVPNIINPFFAELTNRVEEILDHAGCSLLLAKTTETIERQERVIRNMLESGVDGMLLCPVTGTKRKHLKSLLDSRLPFVLFTRPVQDLNASYVGVDNGRGSSLATEYLISLGYRRISYIGGLDLSVTRQERYQGFAKVLSDRGIRLDESLCVTSDTTIRGGYESIERILKMPDPPTAVVCYNDIVAFGVILGLWAAKITPGKDFAVVGFDNLSDAALWSPPLTTVSNPPQSIGTEATALLLERIQNPKSRPRRVILPPSLIIRRSCGE